MSKLATAKTVVEIGQIVTGTFSAIFDRVRKISDMDGRIKKLEEEMTTLKGEEVRFFSKAKDGGPKSTVTGYWLIELKKLFSIVLLKFEDGSRDEYHDHAFNSWNWILKGEVDEEFTHSHLNQTLRPRLRAYFTGRTRMHRVRSKGTTWVFSIRGPWAKTWTEYDPKTEKYVTLTNGRKIV